MSFTQLYRQNVNKLTKDDQLFSFDLHNTFPLSHQADISLMGYLEDKGYNKTTEVTLVVITALQGSSIL